MEVHMPERRIRRIRPPILAAAKEHRQEPTRAEDVLWSAVRGQQLRGLPFRRQHPVGRFILDFYCPRKKSWTARSTTSSRRMTRRAPPHWRR